MAEASVAKGGWAFWVPSHNNHPLVIRPKEEAPRRPYELEWLFDSVWAIFNAQHPTREVPDEERKSCAEPYLL